MFGARRLRSECYPGIVGEIFRLDPNNSGSFDSSQSLNALDLRLVATGVRFVASDEKRLTLTRASRDDRSQLVEFGTFVLFGHQSCQLIAPNTVHHKCLRFANHPKSQLCLMLVPLLSVETITGPRFLLNDEIEHPRLMGLHDPLVVDRPVPLQRL